jgi:succinate dehydrogenase/fumarate reductase flavoprotein subunit
MTNAAQYAHAEKLLDTVDVAVAGGGPAGLAAAAALLHAVPGLRVKVYERANSYKPLGAVRHQKPWIHSSHQHVGVQWDAALLDCGVLLDLSIAPV